MQNQSCFGGRLIVAPLVHLLLIPSTPMHLKLINKTLCYLTDHIIIREVQLKSCHTLIKKCSFNFFEQCITNMVKCLLNSFLRDLKMLCSSSTLLHTVNVSFTFLLVVSIMSNWWFCSCTCTKDQMFPPVCLQEERKPESWFQWSRWKDVYWALKQRRVETELFSLRCFSSRYIWFVTEEMIHVFDS